MDKQLTIIPHLSFCGNCEAAIHTWIAAFGGEVHYLSRWTENTFDMNPSQIGKVMHAEFSLGSTRMAGSDGFTGTGESPVKLMIHMDATADAQHAISLLAQDGSVISPLKPHPAPDDAGCGAIIRDRFGYTWIITCPNPDKQ